MATWTQETLKAWILGTVPTSGPVTERNRAALSRALLYLYARQTSDEQSTGTTQHDNGMGFSGVDSAFLSSVARSVQSYGNMTTGQAPYVAKKLAKYTGQLLAMVNPEPQTATATETEKQGE